MYKRQTSIVALISASSFAIETLADPRRILELLEIGLPKLQIPKCVEDYVKVTLDINVLGPSLEDYIVQFYSAFLTSATGYFQFTSILNVFAGVGFSVVARILYSKLPPKIRDQISKNTKEKAGINILVGLLNALPCLIAVTLFNRTTGQKQLNMDARLKSYFTSIRKNNKSKK